MRAKVLGGFPQFRGGVGANTIIHARTTCTFIDVYIAVSVESCAPRSCRNARQAAFRKPSTHQFTRWRHYTSGFRKARASIRHADILAALSALHDAAFFAVLPNEVVLAHTVRETSDAGALIRVKRDLGLRG